MLHCTTVDPKLLAALRKADLSKLPRSELLELLHIVETFRGADSLLDSIPRVTPRFSETATYRPNHLKPVAKLFSRAEREAIRACVSCPPRHSKTTMLLHGIGWYLSRHPTKNVVFVSNTAGFARDYSAMAKEIAKRFGVKIAKGQARADYWRTTQGGGLFAVGVGGQLTGRGADLLILDDVEKDRQSADSLLQSQRRWEWFLTVPMTRLEPGASIIVNMTRWSPNDIIGRLARGDGGDGWEVINLPAVAESGDPLGREIGEALWPERFPATIVDALERGKDPQASLEVRRKALGDFEFDSLFQGNPRPRGHQMFGTPSYISEVDLQRVLPHCYTRIVCDPAATEKTSADHSAICVGSAYLDPRTKLPVMIIRDVIRAQVTVPKLARLLEQTAKRYRCNVAVEAVGGFKAVPQMLREISPGLDVVELPAIGDKFTRAHPAAAAWQDGRLLVLEGQKWEKVFLAEVQAFTGVGDPQDDQVDAMAHLYRWMSQILSQPARGARRGPAQLMPFG